MKEWLCKRHPQTRAEELLKPDIYYELSEKYDNRIFGLKKLLLIFLLMRPFMLNKEFFISGKLSEKITCSNIRL